MRLTFDVTISQAEKILKDTLPSYFSFCDEEEKKLYVNYFEKEIKERINDGSIEDIDEFINRKQEVIKAINEKSDKEDYEEALKLYQNHEDESNTFVILDHSLRLNYFLVEYF